MRDENRSKEQLIHELDRVLQTMVDGMVMVDVGGEIIYANQAAERILGVRKDEVVGRYYNEREWSQIDEEGRPYPLDQLPLAIALREQREVSGLEHGIIAPNGEVKWLSVNAAPLVDENGELSGAVASFRDITEHKQTLRSLRAERDKAQKYLDIAGVIIVALDNQGEITLMNRKGLQVLGYTEEEVIGKNWFDTFMPDSIKERVREVFQDLMAGNIEVAEHFQNPCLTKSGEERMIAWHNTVVTDDSGHIFGTLSSGEDVTERLKLEEQLRQAQKMEAIGRLTAGIAHDFNNMLTAINGFAELMQLEVRADDPLHDSVNKILTSGRRAADLVRQLLAFSRKQIFEPQVLNLNYVVTGMEKMLQRVIGEHIHMEIVLSPDLWPVKVDLAQIEQVIVNLAVNARDAMPGGGQLTIETANITLGEDYAASHLEVQPGDYVLLAISDTGGGMSQEVKAHIFEPFFTTKELGRGTGLGLSTVYGIVKQSGGHIWVYSEEKQGTTFKIYLPRAQEMPRPAARQPLIADIPVGDETILLVEDDSQVRDLARRTLERQGYTVLEARNSREAWQVFTSHTGPIHLLLTDVVMPGLSGKSVADQLAEINPDLKVLFMSGYTGNIVVHHGELEEGIAFLQKPLSPSALARKVRQVLDTPQER